MWSVLGGAWTAKFKGVAFDSIQGCSSSAAGARWARSVGLNPTASFSIRLYSEQGARLLAETWTARMNAFYAMSGGRSDRRFSDADVAGVTNSAEFEAMRRASAGQRLARLKTAPKTAPKNCAKM